MFSLFRKRTVKAKITRTDAERPRNGLTSRTVAHQHWIRTDELKRGMYVVELSVPWEETNFMFQGFDVDSNQLVDEIRDVATHALVKTQKVAKLSSKNARQFCTG